MIENKNWLKSFRMSSSNDDVLEWWRTNERVVDQIPEISDAIMEIQSVSYNRKLPSDLPVMERGQTQLTLPPIIPNSDEDNLVKCLNELNIDKINTQGQFSRLTDGPDRPDVHITGFFSGIIGLVASN